MEWNLVHMEHELTKQDIGDETFQQRPNFKRKNINVKFIYLFLNLCNYVLKKSIHVKKK